MATWNSLTDGHYANENTWHPVWSSIDINPNNSTVAFSGDATADLFVGDHFAIFGSNMNDGHYTVFTIGYDEGTGHTTIAIVGSFEGTDDDSGQLHSLEIPKAGDDVIIQNFVTMDIAVATLNSLTVNNGGTLQADDTSVDYFAAMSNPITMTSGTLTGLYVSCAITCSVGGDAGNVIMNSVIANGGLTVNNVFINWNGVGEIGTGMSITSGAITAEDLTFTNPNMSIDFNDGGLSGTLTFEGLCSANDLTSGESPPSFGGTVTLKDSFYFQNCTATCSGTFNVSKTFYFGLAMLLDGGPATVNLTTKAAEFINGDVYGVNTQYTGPAGGGVLGNMSISL